MNWPTVQIGQVCAVGDGAHSKVERQIVGIPYLTSKNIGQGVLDLSKIDYISQEDYERLFSQKSKAVTRPQFDDVLLGIIGTFGTHYRYSASDNFGVSSSVAILRPQRGVLDGKFLNYVISSPDFKNAHAEVKGGSVQGYTNLPTIRILPIPLPPFEIQQRIASILGVLDNKIELNRRMNETLEEMARTIFRSWFVDFDPVRIKARGGDPVKELGISPEIAALFPDSFVESELGEIPSGWSVGCFGDIAYQIRQSAKAADIDVHEPYVGLEHIARKSLSLSEWGRGGDVSSQKTRFQTGNILFGKLRPYFHKVCIAPIDGVCSTDIVVIGPKHPELHSFVALWASESSMIESVTSSSGGTRMPRTSWSDIARFGIPIPPSRVIQAFESIVAPMIRKLMMSVFEQQALTETRDYLLPKLLSGEVEVAEKRTQDSQNLVEVSN